MPSTATGQFNDALAASNRSLEIYPGYVNGWINRGQILYNIGYWYEDVAHDTATANALYAEQLTAFEKAISLDPDNAEAWFNKGYALAGMQRYDEAIAAFDQVRAIDPSYPNLQKNREIAVQLRDATGGSPVTTGSSRAGNGFKNHFSGIICPTARQYTFPASSREWYCRHHRGTWCRHPYPATKIIFFPRFPVIFNGLSDFCAYPVVLFFPKSPVNRNSVSCEAIEKR